MKAAPLVALAEILDAKLIGEVKEVRTIPLQLAAITAKVPLSLRGSLPGTIVFYSWVFAGGKHGGRRLFQADEGSVHVLFLKQDGPYLRTVGDYTAHDLELRRAWVPQLITFWKDRASRYADHFQRLAAALIEAELEDDQSPPLSHYSPLDFELEGLTSQSFVQSTFDSHCISLSNPPGRAAACSIMKWAQGPR